MTNWQKHTGTERPAEFNRGELLSWNHGDSIRVATVMKIEGGYVLLSGMTSDYWMRISTLKRKVEESLCASATMVGSTNTG